MKPITRQLLSDVTLSMWTDVDVSAYVGSDAGSVAGVMLEIINTSGSEYSWGVRKNVSTDTLTGVIEDTGHTFVAIGVDANDVFELYQTHADIDVYMVGYFTNAEAVFATNAGDVSLSVTNTWTDITVHADALCGFFLVYANGAQAAYGFRENSSTDSRVSAIFNGDLRGAMMACDSGGKVEGRIGNTAIDFYQVGYLTDNFASFTNAKDYSTATTGSYEETDLSGDIPAGNSGAFFHGYPSDSAEHKYGIRKNGESSIDNYYDYSYHQYGWVEMDANRVIEQKNETSACDLYIWGYTSEPSSATSFIPRIMIY